MAVSKRKKCLMLARDERFLRKKYGYLQGAMEEEVASILSSNEYSDYKRRVISRDKVCQCCFSQCLEMSLGVHHITNIEEDLLRSMDMNNGITLCSECHKEFHDKFGHNDNDIEQLCYFIAHYGDSDCNLRDFKRKSKGRYNFRPMLVRIDYSLTS